MNIENHLADLQKSILKITSLYGTIGNNQKKQLQTSFKKLEEAINYTRCCTELKDKPKLNFGDWKFSQGLRYMSDFTYKNAKGELFDADVVNNTYNDYYNL